jgi:hypothetical protein
VATVQGILATVQGIPESEGGDPGGVLGTGSTDMRAGTGSGARAAAARAGVACAGVYPKGGRVLVLPLLCGCAALRGLAAGCCTSVGYHVDGQLYVISYEICTDTGHAPVRG